METFLLFLLSGFPDFLSHLALGIVLLALFTFIYVKVTPYHELELIRSGNVAAAASLSGAIIGFTIPLAQTASQSVHVVDMLIWGGIALVVQLLAFFAVRMLIPSLAKDIPDGKMAQGIFLGVISVAVGMLNAASMTE
jgi:putative membrane protein